MSAALQPLSYICKSRNLAGIQSFQYAVVDWINYILPQAEGGSQSLSGSDVVFHPGFNWFQGAYLKQSTDYSQRSAFNNQGDIHTATISFSIPGDTTALRNQFRLMAGYRYILRLTYPDGTEKLIGSQDQPLRFSHRFNSGTQKVGDLKGHIITFRGRLSEESSFWAI